MWPIASGEWIELSLYVCLLIQLLCVCWADRSLTHCGLSLIPSPYSSIWSFTVVCPLPTWELVGSWLLSVVRPHWSESARPLGDFLLPFVDSWGKKDHRPGMSATFALPGLSAKLNVGHVLLLELGKRWEVTVWEYNVHVVLVELNDVVAGVIERHQ